MCCCISSQLKNGDKRPPCDICSLFRAGPGSKRLGIDGDREAIPLTLQIAYSKVSARDLHKDKATSVQGKPVSLLGAERGKR